ncbi:hypothetical protein GA0115240_10814 [Streptomyces sp. DvalAA-14]|uniref:hypothetical protein n=1 Tax=unclassified Streptomyces TaxID=2593676 RepID=UPI00081B4AF2|nr:MULTISPECIES: hypothetical protein [unclassified Streptomyces]MYS19440.1 hypothetical protein [Streptomyces sp. SID4948]SCD44450.1 hypothetical protein GA0115240_10814 [Streptomyces sp. DvalAA-14]
MRTGLALSAVAARPRGTWTPSLRYSVSATFPICVTAAINCRSLDTAVGAGAVQA